MTQPAVIEDSGGRDPDASRDCDHYGPGAGGKKRKVPAFTQISGRSDSDESADGKSDSKFTGKPITFSLNYRLPRSPAAKSGSFRKALFLRRKAALITLYLDAQSAIIAGTAKTSKDRTLPDVPVFEQLLPAMEDLGLSDWAPDKPGWRNNWQGDRLKGKTLEQWRTDFDHRQRAKVAKQPVVRGGWAPEGSFEFEMASTAAVASRQRAKDQAALEKLAYDLRAVVLSSTRPPPPLPAPSPPSDEKPSSKTKRRIEKKEKKPPEPVTVESAPMSNTPSKEGSEAQTGKKKTKKKRSVLANQSNPHHVNNYRSSRTVSPPGGEQYEMHSTTTSALLFPQPSRFLSARPQRKTAPLPGSVGSVQPSRTYEEDFLCCFCEFQLFFGTEVVRKRAIRRLKAERKRKEIIKSKAKNVADGKGTLNDDEESDYEENCDDDGHGRCTCGRMINSSHSHGKSRLKPPETDPPPESRGPLGPRREQTT